LKYKEVIITLVAGKTFLKGKYDKCMNGEWLKHIARLNLPIYQYESDKTKIIYAGYSSIKRNYFLRLMMNNKQDHVFLGRRWFWEIPHLIKSYNIDMAISEISPIALNHFQRYNGYIIPEWTTIRIKIDRPISEICNKHVSDFKDVRRRIGIHNLTYEMLSDRESFNSFYEKYYLPYMNKRHGEEAWIEDLDKLYNTSPSIELMAVRENDTIAGVALIRKSEGTLHLLRLGLLDGDDKYRIHGVIGAMYYFGIIEGQKTNCRYMDMGGTRPFLTDGLTKYKMRLGGEFVSELSPKKEYLWLGINEGSGIAKEFLHKNQFMHVNKEFKLFRYTN
jgi:hypothetical protein